MLEYLYRDASNYKQYGRVVLAGALSIKDIRHLLIDGEYFIPSQAGLPDLQHKFRAQGFEYPTEDDHAWHEVISLRLTVKEPTVSMRRKNFLSRLRSSYGRQRLS